MSWNLEQKVLTKKPPLLYKEQFLKCFDHGVSDNAENFENNV